MFLANVRTRPVLPVKSNKQHTVEKERNKVHVTRRIYIYNSIIENRSTVLYIYQILKKPGLKYLSTNFVIIF